VCVQGHGFVGRDAEMQSLEAQIKVCIEESSARMVLVTGAPGVGKSRLRHEFLRQATKRQDAITILLGSGELIWRNSSDKRLSVDRTSPRRPS